LSEDSLTRYAKKSKMLSTSEVRGRKDSRRAILWATPLV